MGIDGLLRHLKDCNKEKNLEEYRGMRAAVDTYAWLHKIIKGPSGGQIIQGKNKRKYINDCIRRVEKISNAGIDLTLVFDGGVLPRKQGEEEQRRKKRQENYVKGCDLIRQGNKEQGFKKMIDSIDVSPDIAYKLIEELKKQNYKFIVAPYEADAQLAYLSRKGLVDVIITEDSDLLAFGAKRILYKLDFTTLNGYEICLDSIRETVSTGFNYFSHNMFLTTCVMAGCDYLPQIKGVGIKLAQKVISRNGTLKRALNQLSTNKPIPENYQQNFIKALLTFRFQRVYCPERKACVSVNEFEPQKWLEEQEAILESKKKWSLQVFDETIFEYAKQLSSDPSSSDWDFLGKKLQSEIAIKVAEGDVNPINFSKYDEECLNRLEYKEGNLAFENFYQSNHSKGAKKGTKDPTQSTIEAFLKEKQRKIPFEYRSVRNRSLKDDYIVVNEEEDGKKTMFPTKAIDNNNKRKLRFHEESDEDSINEIASMSHDKPLEMLISDKEKSYELVENFKSQNFDEENKKSYDCRSEQLKNLEKKPTSLTSQKTKSSFEEISEMFNPIFSEQFLRSPFSS